MSEFILLRFRAPKQGENSKILSTVLAPLTRPWASSNLLYLTYGTRPLSQC